ncbi:hypothetical protein [Aquibacillus kalidii]|uniref:hypothetical protein n=1 Tax=Aquibacillus kalidii TaxID=2762597 RepID=UPI001646504E|nr:hypothetical protein [Aquibacillus kalidii]
MASRKSFYFIGILLFFIFVVRLILFVMTDTFSISEILSWGGLAFMSFAIGYLQPQLVQKDERMQYIKQKTMNFSLFAIIGYILLLMIGLQTNLFIVTAEEVLGILIGLTAITIWMIWIIVAKRI